LKKVDIYKELRQIVGKQAQFRGLQESVLKAIIKNKSPILVIIGTGAGKSLLFQLPAYSQKSGTTVVIILLKLLEKSLYKQYQRAGILYIRWDPQQSNCIAQIVLVQPESAISTKFA
jgi:superfamily II DNA helicase RecQ